MKSYNVLLLEVDLLSMTHWTFISWLTKKLRGLPLPFLMSRWLLEENKAKIHLNSVLVSALGIVSCGASWLSTPSELHFSAK